MVLRAVDRGKQVVPGRQRVVGVAVEEVLCESIDPKIPPEPAEWFSLVVEGV